MAINTTYLLLSDKCELGVGTSGQRREKISKMEHLSTFMIQKVVEMRLDETRDKQYLVANKMSRDQIQHQNCIRRPVKASNVPPKKPVQSDASYYQMDKILADNNHGVVLVDEETERFFDDLYRECFQDYFRSLVLEYVKNL